MLKQLRWTLHDDGSYDLKVPHFSLLNAYPSFDFEAVRPLGVAVERAGEGGTISYRLPLGTIYLTFISQDNGEGLILRTRLEGFSTAPHWVHPFARARLDGVTRFFRTGVGFSGPTGFINLETEPDHYSFESYLCTALSGEPDGWLSVGALEQHRFQQKCHLENQVHRRQFRNREIDARPAFFAAGFSTESIPLAESSLELPDLHFLYHPVAFDSLRQLASRIGKHHGARLNAPPTCHWCSCYERGSFLTEQEFMEFLAGARRLKEPLHTVQIDDGYMTHLGDWLEFNQCWPSGLKQVFQGISAEGYTPGIWVGPFMVASRSRLAGEHPDWLLHWKDGSRVIPWKNYNGTRDSEEHYVLDTSHPDAMNYLRDVFMTFYQWGARMFKTDFLEWGFRDSTRVRRHTPGKTGTEYFVDVLRMIRSAIGEDSYWLACISYFQPCIGYVDAMRCTSDVGPEWSSTGGTGNDGVGGGIENMIQEMIGCQYFNNVFWQNDPDVTYLRNYHIGLSNKEITTLALFNGILGGCINTSDAFHKLPPDRLDLWHFIRPQRTRWTATLPFFGKARPFLIALREFPEHHGWALLILNANAEPDMDRWTTLELTGKARVVVFAWGSGGAEALGEREEWVESLQGHESRLFYLSSDGTPPPAHLTLGGGIRE